MNFTKAFTFACLLLCINIHGQTPKKLTSAEIHHKLEKLNFLGTALFVAAHPDDENTRLISYVSNHTNARMVYLALTRGDGGQNLIGSELREQLGVLRTQELLAARRIDGGEQRFSRANDFGFSKNPDETFQIWDREEVLGDVVWTIRELKPDVVINRFDHRTPGTTHGHHTASAILSFEAFDIVNDPKAYPEQLKLTETWQPKRLYLNTNWWFYGSRENFEKADKSKLSRFDIGTYYPDLGVSNNEIASLASSQHLCQGFGRVETRGSQEDYLEFLKGDEAKDNNDLFDGIDTSWSRVEGGEAVGKILYDIEANFNYNDPSVHVPKLVEAYTLLQKVTDDHWRELKSKELESIILACSGIYIEANTQSYSAAPGEKVVVNVEAINRSKNKVSLKSFQIMGTAAAETTTTDLTENNGQNFEVEFTVPDGTKPSTPYWLDEKETTGMYKVSNQKLIGMPETPAPFIADFEVDFNGTSIHFRKPLVHHYAKRDKGEIYEPFRVLPPVSAGFKDNVVLFSNQTKQELILEIKSGKDNISGEVKFNYPKGWQVSPASFPFSIKQKGDTQRLTIQVTAPSGESQGVISPSVQLDGKTYSKTLYEIDYAHIPKQSVLSNAEVKVVKSNIKKVGSSIGYIVGAGDKVPESLRQIGYQVSEINVSNIEEGSLDGYDAIVVGIRAYNVVDALKFKQPFLLDYVKNGGNLILQYNTAGRRGLDIENLAPYSLSLSRDRVTNEDATVEIIAKDNALMNFPNKITEKDFEGWVQERGLYFPSEWGKEFTPILSMHDEGETAKTGSLLVAKYGKGNYIYTGLSFFRELPAGVPGAYRLFANMLSLGNQNTSAPNETRGK